jgi:hypothetical protein
MAHREILVLLVAIQCLEIMLSLVAALAATAAAVPMPLIHTAVLHYSRVMRAGRDRRVTVLMHLHQFMAGQGAVEAVADLTHYLQQKVAVVHHHQSLLVSQAA